MEQSKLWQKGIVYQIYPRSFADSNGDGIGDIPGIISKLDYLKSLGISIIWLSPVYPTPNADFGYDISDYMGINPEFGTMEDFDRLIKEAKKRGIRIVMDLVVNHTSDEHPWFKASKDANSPYHEYYIYKKGPRPGVPPNNWTSNFGGPAWEYVPEIDEWYLHLFSKKQPDLNWRSEKVIEEVEKVLRFWLDRGVYGFRCDVINQIYKESFEDGKWKPWLIGQEHYLMKEGNHAILKRLHEDVFAHYDCMTVGETYNVDFKNARRFMDGELDMVFQFDTMNADKVIVPIFVTKRWHKKFKKTLSDWEEQVNWNAVYLENHDQKRSVSRFGSKTKHDLSAKMLATLLLTLKGTPFIYQGEEIGMEDYPLFKKKEYKDPVNFWLYGLLRKFHFSDKQCLRFVNNVNRDHARTPMQWDDGPAAGFSSNQATWLPVNPDYKKYNVKAEEANPDSVLSYYRKLIKLRSSDEVLVLGSYEKMDTKSSIFAYYRLYGGKMHFVLLNLTDRRVTLPKAIREMKGKVLLSNYEGAGFTYKKFLRPYESLIVDLSE